MINNIYIQDQKLIELKNISRYTYYILENVALQSSLVMKKKCLIQCQDCKKFREIQFYSLLLKKNYLCPSCVITGKRNPFYGRKHTKETKEKQSKIKKEMYQKEGNPFYGKKHTQETKNKIRNTFLIKEISKGKNNPFYGKKHTIEVKNKLREKAKAYALKNPEFYGKGKNKKSLNKTQLYKVKRDKEKKDYIINNTNYIIMYIWEDDIYNNNFSILDKIERIINENI